MIGVQILVVAIMGLFLFATISRPCPEPTQPPIKMSIGGSFSGSKVAGAWSWPLTHI